MSRNDFDDTLQKIEQLSPGPHQPALAAESVRIATAFVVQMRQLMADTDSLPWQTPLVENGGGGVVVLLWQDGQRTLSLVAKPDGGMEWFYEPGATGYGVDATELLRKGQTAPEDFAGRVWPAWVRGSDPSADTE